MKEKPANVLLLVLDSVRAKNCSMHGHPEPTTPFLDQFAAERATFYANAKAPGARSLTSHVSMFSGLDVAQHGVVSPSDKLDAGYNVFDRLRKAGYTTGVFSENDWLTSVDVGLKDGFDTVVGAADMPFPRAIDPDGFVSVNGPGAYSKFLRAALSSGKPLKSVLNGLAKKGRTDFPMLVPRFLTDDTSATYYVDQFLDWSHHADRPWAACINLMDAHMPYEPSESSDRWDDGSARKIQSNITDSTWDFQSGKRPWWQLAALESLYDGGIRDCDEAVREVVEALQKRGELDDTLLIVTADHGEGFGEVSRINPERRIVAHGVSSHEALLHVPLVVRAPGQDEPDVIDRPFSLTSIPSLIMAEALREPSKGENSAESPVMATAAGLDDPGKRRAESFVNDVEPWIADTRVLYEYDGGNERILKHVSRGDNNVTVVCLDAQTQYVQESGSDGGRRVKKAFDSIEPVQATDTGAGIGGLDEATKDRLERLGYL